MTLTIKNKTQRLHNLRTALIGIVLLWLTGCASFFGTPDTVTIERGDTLYSLSKRYDIPLRDLIDANGLKPPYTLKVGQVLRLPVSSYHIVTRGDTLYAVSRQYGIDVNTLKEINDLEAPYTLNIGQKIMLRGSTSSKPTVSQTTNKTTAKPKTNSIKVAGNSSKRGISAPKKKAVAATTTTAQRTTTSKKTQTVSQKRKTKFAWPVRGTVISRFGTIGKGRANDGINIRATRGTAVNAADAGTVAYAGNELKGFGNLILIRHPDGWITAYAHNDRLLVKKGQKVHRGEKVATVGTTGGVNTPQLHFEVRAGKKAVDPIRWLP